MSNLIWGAVDVVNRVTSNVRDIVQRHRKKVIALVVIGGTTYLAVRYVRGKLDEIKKLQSDQEQQLLRMRMQTYFDNAQRSCDGSIGSAFIVTLKDNLTRILEIPSTNDLRNSMKDNTAKQMLWDKVKINSFSRTICSIYATCLLILFVRVEVNILGKYLYMDVDTAGTQKNDNEKSISEDTKKQYLNFTDFILNKGLSDLADYIHTQVQEELKDVPLTKKMNSDDIVNLVQKIRARVEYPVNDTPLNLSDLPNSNANDAPIRVRKVQTFHQFLLPPEEGQSLSGQLTCLIDETRDILESDKFHRILTVCLNEGFHCFAREFKESYAKATSQAPSASETPDPTSVQLPLAKITPIIKQVFFTLMDAQPQPVMDTSQEMNLTKGGNNVTWNTSNMSNMTAPLYNYNSRNLVQAIIDMKDLEEFSYYVFTSIE
mmetsp:Transcript_722/g.991  ORF Transcript_722/g.991 Transcript_722/m.991 type:complete len:431 (-) Transcript_722:1378-2670(-)